MRIFFFFCQIWSLIFLSSIFLYFYMQKSQIFMHKKYRCKLFVYMHFYFTWFHQINHIKISGLEIQYFRSNSYCFIILTLMATSGADVDRSRRGISSKQSLSIEVSSLSDPTLNSITSSTWTLYKRKTSLIYLQYICSIFKLRKSCFKNITDISSVYLQYLQTS